MKKLILLVMVAPFVLLFSCQSGDEIDNKKLPDAKPIALRFSEKVQTDNAFAFDLFKTTYKHSDEENVFISPLSVSMALNMVVNGAVGDTKNEMLDALRAKGYSMEDINEYSKSLRQALMEIDQSTNLQIANSIWCREGFPVKNAFLDVNRSAYNAEVKAIDFTSPKAVTEINNWCAKQTNDKIKTIIEEIPGSAMMFLINAVYFKGIWMSKFDKKDTQKDDFYLSDGTINQVEMMRQTQRFNYTEDETGRYIELPYGNNAFSMILMLPQDGKSIQDILQSLDNNKWKQTVNKLYGVKVNLRLPRFKSECRYEMQDPILPDMGMEIPFSSSADFSGISDVPLKISQVIHKTFVEVNEEGTEAAAVTNIGMDLTANPDSELKPIDYFVNKPFLFAIREKSTGVVLFIGKIGEIE